MTDMHNGAHRITTKTIYDSLFLSSPPSLCVHNVHDCHDLCRATDRPTDPKLVRTVTNEPTGTMYHVAAAHATHTWHTNSLVLHQPNIFRLRHIIHNDDDDDTPPPLTKMRANSQKKIEKFKQLSTYLVNGLLWNHLRWLLLLHGWLSALHHGLLHGQIWIWLLLLLLLLCQVLLRLLLLRLGNECKGALTTIEEIRMIRINVRHLDLDQVDDEGFQWLLILSQQCNDKFLGSVLEIGETGQSLLTVLHHGGQLLKHLIHASNGRLLQLLHLSLDQHLKGGLGNEQGGSRALGIANRRSNIRLVQVLTAVHLQQEWQVLFGENVIDASTAKQIIGRQVNVATLDRLGIVGRELGQQLEQQGTVGHVGLCHRYTILDQSLLSLLDQGRDFGTNLRQHLTNMIQQYRVQRLGQVSSAHAIGHRFVGGVLLEEQCLVSHGLTNTLIAIDVTLTTVHHTNEASLEWNDLTGQNIDGIRSPVHQIQLCQHAQRPITSLIDLCSQLECITVGQIGIGCRDCQNDTVGLTDILKDHVLDLVLNITRLVTHWHLGDARQVNNGQVQHVWRINFEMDGQRRNSLVFSRETIGFIVNLLTNLIKVKEALVGHVEELTPLLIIVLTLELCLLVRCSGILVLWCVNELENEGTTSDDTGASGQEVSTDDIFENGALACTTCFFVWFCCFCLFVEK